MSTTGLLALLVTFSAGIHAALVPEHLKEMPPLGYAFIAAAAIGCILACALISRPDDPRVPLLAGLFCVGQIAAWVLCVAVHVPGLTGTPEGIETIALVSKAAELAAVALAFPLALPRLSMRHAGIGLRRAVQIARRGMGEPKTKEIRREETLDAALVEFAERHAGRG